MVIVLVTFPFRTYSGKTNISAWLGRGPAGSGVGAGREVWEAGGRGLDLSRPPSREGRARRLPVPQFPRLSNAGGYGAEGPVRVTLLMKRTSLAEAKIKKRSTGKRVIRLLSWVVAGDYESRSAAARTEIAFARARRALWPVRRLCSGGDVTPGQARCCPAPAFQPRRRGMLVGRAGALLLALGTPRQGGTELLPYRGAAARLVYQLMEPPCDRPSVQ